MNNTLTKIFDTINNIKVKDLARWGLAITAGQLAHDLTLLMCGDKNVSKINAAITAVSVNSQIKILQNEDNPTLKELYDVQNKNISKESFDVFDESKLEYMPVEDSNETSEDVAVK